MEALMTGVTSAVTGIIGSIGTVVTEVFANEGLSSLIALGIGFAVVGLAVSLIPRFRR